MDESVGCCKAGLVKRHIANRELTVSYIVEHFILVLGGFTPGFGYARQIQVDMRKT